MDWTRLGAILTMRGMAKKPRGPWRRTLTCVQSSRPQVAIPDEVNHELRRLAPVLARGRSIGSKKASIGGFLGAIVTHFLDLPLEEQQEVINYGIARLEGLLKHEQPLKVWRKPREKPNPGGEEGGEGGENEEGNGDGGENPFDPTLPDIGGTAPGRKKRPGS